MSAMAKKEEPDQVVVLAPRNYFTNIKEISRRR